MSYYDDKPKKFEYGEKPKYDYPMEPERGGCLTAFLVVAFLGQIASIFIALSLQSDINSLSSSVRASASSEVGFAQMIVYFVIIVAVIGLVCIWGLWNWKRWGYYGIIALYVIGAILNLVSGSIPTAVGSFVGLGVLVYLMRDKADYLD